MLELIPSTIDQGAGRFTFPGVSVVGVEDITQFIVKAYSTQTNNLVEIQDNAGNALIAISLAGDVVFGQASIISTTAGDLTLSPAEELISTKNTRIKLANATLIIDDTGQNKQWHISNSGGGLQISRHDNNVFVATRFSLGTDANNVVGFNTANATAQLNAVAATLGLGAIYLQSIANANVATALLKAGLSQTAPIIELQDSVGGTLFTIDADASDMVFGAAAIISTSAGDLTISPASNLNVTVYSAFGGSHAPLGVVHIDQSVDDANIPVLIVDQADISEGFINFIGSDRGVISEGVSSVESVRVELNGVVRRLALYANA